MTALLARFIIYALLPAVTLSAIAATIGQYWPNVRALLRAAKEL